MSKLDNKHLIKINNYLLKNNSDKLEFLSISWLYIKRLHPHYLENYKILNRNKFQIVFFSLALFVLNILKFCKLFIKSLKSADSNKLKINQEILIISHFINKHNYNNGDFYYKNIDNYLRKRKLLSKTILINDQLHPKIKINKNYIILPNIIKSFDLIKIFIKQLIVIPMVFKKILSSNNNLEKKILMVLIPKCICPSTIYNLVKYRQFLNILNNSKIKMCFCNFEGNAIERVIFFALTKNNKKILKIGYSHTTDFPMRNGVYINFKKNLMPDYIFLNSKIVYKEFFSRNFKNLVLCGLLSNPSFKLLPKCLSIKKNHSILLIPEGIQDELVKFIRFVKLASYKYPEYKFIIRPHPVLNNISNIKTKNIHVSKNSLEKDIQESQYVIFRGSTLIIHCINNDLIPIYLNLGENYNFHIFPKKFDNKLDLINPKNIDKFNLNDYTLNKDLKKFSMNYFEIYNESVVKKFLVEANK